MISKASIVRAVLAELPDATMKEIISAANARWLALDRRDRYIVPVNNSDVSRARQVLRRKRELSAEAESFLARH